MNMVVTHQGPATRRTPITPSEIFFFFFNDFARLYPQKSNSNLNCPSPGHPHILFLWSHGPAVLCLWVWLWLGGVPGSLLFYQSFCPHPGLFVATVLPQPPTPPYHSWMFGFWDWCFCAKQGEFRLRGKSFLFTWSWDFLGKDLPDGTPSPADAAAPAKANLKHLSALA